MSLLLDALKKAADDKEKNKKEAPDTSESPKKDEPSSEDLDLELEMDDFPEVDKGFDKHQQEVSKEYGAVEQDALLIEDEIKQSENPEPVKDDTEIELAEYDSIDTAPVINEDASLKSNNKQDADAQPGSAKISKTVSSVSRDRRRPSPEKLDSTIQMDAASLDALINKSNNQSKSRRMQRTILYIIAIVILLTGTAVYFLLEFTQSTDSIYTAGTTTQQRADYIQRNGNESVIEQTQAPVVLEKPQSPPLRVSAAKPKQSLAATSPKITKPQEKKVTIIHKKVEDPTDVLLRQAYQAFNEADYVTSRQLYESVLEKEKNNNDAMLGVAAVAVKEQRLEYAKQKYLQLLYLDPKDSYAKAGLTAVESQQNTTLNESQLKMMLREQTDAPHLHFALGSLYAAQEKWPDAQAEFFSAWSTDNQNPDYAFNLAVSLDHMDKSRQAIELYELSIKLLATGNGNFSKDDVQNRIMVLKNAADKNAN